MADASMFDAHTTDGSSTEGRVHDLGGRSGFGPIPVDDDVLFHADWERRAFAVTQFAQRAAGFNTDAFRHGIEREDPEVYLSAPYFEKWIRNAERMLVEGGVLAPDEVAAKMTGGAGTGEARRTTDATAPVGRGALRKVDDSPQFTVGEQVRVRPDHRSPGHTRLPNYVRGHVGTVELVNAGWIYPDTHAHGAGEQPTWVYAVRFASIDLWPDADRRGERHSVLVDLFEPYLEQP